MRLSFVRFTGARVARRGARAPYQETSTVRLFSARRQEGSLRLRLSRERSSARLPVWTRIGQSRESSRAAWRSEGTSGRIAVAYSSRRLEANHPPNLAADVDRQCRVGRGGVAFYGFLAFVPLLAAIILIYGLARRHRHGRRYDGGAVTEILPSDIAKLLSDQVVGIVHTSEGKKGVGLVIAVAIATLRRQQRRGAVITALNIAYEQKRERGPLWKYLSGRADHHSGRDRYRTDRACRAAAIVATLGIWRRVPHQPQSWLGKVAAYLAMTLVGGGNRGHPVPLRSLPRACALGVDHARLDLCRVRLAAVDAGVRLLRRQGRQLRRDLRLTGGSRWPAHLDVLVGLCVRLRRRAQPRDRAPDGEGFDDREAAPDGHARGLGGGSRCARRSGSPKAKKRKKPSVSDQKR